MDDESKLRANTDLSMAASRSQAFGQYSHPYISQEGCDYERSFQQDVFLPNSVLGYPGHGPKLGRSDVGNSFLSLLSGPLLLPRADCQQPNTFCPTSFPVSFPSCQNSAPQNASWPSLSASEASLLNQTVGHGGFGSSAELSQVFSSKILPSNYNNRVIGYQDQLDSGIFNQQGSDNKKQEGFCGNQQGGISLQGTLPQWLSDVSQFRLQQKIQTRTSRVPKSVSDATCDETQRSMLALRPRQRVFCVGTNGLLSGELVLNNTGSLGVVCSCHSKHMSVANFCEHSGLFHPNPGTAVHMENGETISAWRKSFFSQLGVKVVDDDNCWNLNNKNGKEAEKATISSEPMEKAKVVAEKDHSMAKARMASLSQPPFYHSTSHEVPEAQSMFNSNINPLSGNRSTHAQNASLPQNLIYSSMPLSFNQPALDKMKDNTPISNYNPYISSQRNTDFISSSRLPMFPNESLPGGRNLHKGFLLSCLNNYSDIAPSEKDASSGFELRLGQPSQKNMLDSSLQSTMTFNATNAAVNRYRSSFLDQKFHGVYNPSLPVSDKYILQNAATVQEINEKGNDRKAENRLRLNGGVCNFEPELLGHTKEDRARGFEVTIPSEYNGHAETRSRDAPTPEHMSKATPDSETTCNRSTDLSYTACAVETADLSELRRKVQNVDNATCQTEHCRADGSTLGFDLPQASSIELKKGLENRLRCGTDIEQGMHLDINVQKSNCITSKTLTSASIDGTNIRNSPTQLGLSSSCGITEYSGVFKLRAINSSILKSCGSGIPTLAEQLQDTKALDAADVSKMMEDLAHQIATDTQCLHNISEEQMKNFLGLKSDVQALKLGESIPSISNPHIKPMLKYNQGQTGERYGHSSVSVQRENNEEEHGIPENVSRVIPHVSHAYYLQETSGLNNSRCNTHIANVQDAKSYEVPKKQLAQHIDCNLVERHGRSSSRSFQQINTSCRDLRNIEVGDQASHGPNDAEVNVCKEMFVGASAGSDCAAVVCAGENNLAIVDESFSYNPKSKMHENYEQSCQILKQNLENVGCIMEGSSLRKENTLDFKDTREVVKAHFTDSSVKNSPKCALPTEPTDEHQMSNVCSEGSDSPVSEFSDAVGHTDMASGKLTETDVVDEGSGIGKCSSDGIDNGVWTRSKQAYTGSGNHLLGTSVQLTNLSSDVYNGSKVKTSISFKRPVNSPGCTSARNTYKHKGFVKPDKLQKKRKFKKWKHLDATSFSVEKKGVFSTQKNHCSNTNNTNSSSSSSSEETKSNDNQITTASVSSNQTQLLGMKRKKSLLSSKSSRQSRTKVQKYEEKRNKDMSVQHVQVKGDKLVIQLRQGALEKNAKQCILDDIEQLVERASSRKILEHEDPNFENGQISRFKGTKIGEDRSKSSKYGRLVTAPKPIKISNNKQIPKGGKMVSLRSILKYPEKQIRCQARKSENLRSGYDWERPIITRGETSSVKVSSLQRMKKCRLLERQSNMSEFSTECNRKTYDRVDTPKEVRKRSLCKLSNESPSKMKNHFSSDAMNDSRVFNPTRNFKACSGQETKNGSLLPCNNQSSKMSIQSKTESQKDIVAITSCTTNKANHSIFSSANSSLGSGRLKIQHTNNELMSAICNAPIPKFEGGSKISTRDNDVGNETEYDINIKKTANNPACNVSKKRSLQSTAEGAMKQGDTVSMKQGDTVSEQVRGSCSTSSKLKNFNALEDAGCIFEGSYSENPLVKRKRIEGSDAVSPGETPCCVCGDSNEEGLNRLVQCQSCLIKMHQACYGISKIPKSGWKCRACKSNLTNIVCVLCGYGGGALTHAKRAENVIKSLLHCWKVKKEDNSKNLKGNPCPNLPTSKIDDALVIRSPEQFRGKERESDLAGLSKPMPVACVEKEDKRKNANANQFETDANSNIQEGNTKVALNNRFKVDNTITAGVGNPSVTQWVHMVCGLWTPGTKCVNVRTMGVFDVFGVCFPRRKQVCSVCNRPGGLCIQCRVAKCQISFHPWCAHRKGLLQSEVEGEKGEKVGFYGRCIAHAEDAKKHCKVVQHEKNLALKPDPETRAGNCARTEGYKGCKSWEERKEELQKQTFNDNTRGVSQEQINAWLHINGRKSSRAVVKNPGMEVKTDYRREYLRYRQEKRWKRLVVYKSGIHALGLYTAEFISKGEMVVEYVGEIVGLRVADKREAYYHSRGKMRQEGACYFFRIDKENIIDATRKGGIARFVNHSCSPNCVAKVITVKTQKKVVFFAERDINAGEEITYDYNFNHEDEGKKIPCFCKSRICRRYLN